MNVDIVGSRRNRPQLSTCHDDDDDNDRVTVMVRLKVRASLSIWVRKKLEISASLGCMHALYIYILCSRV